MCWEIRAPSQFSPCPLTCTFLPHPQLVFSCLPLPAGALGLASIPSPPQPPQSPGKAAGRSRWDGGTCTSPPPSGRSKEQGRVELATCCVVLASRIWAGHSAWWEPLAHPGLGTEQGPTQAVQFLRGLPCVVGWGSSQWKGELTSQVSVPQCSLTQGPGKLGKVALLFNSFRDKTYMLQNQF